jgi:hypothetical protein
MPLPIIIATDIHGVSDAVRMQWRSLGGSPRCHPQSRARLCYGSRIRDHLAVKPRRAVSLVFADHEASFEPARLVAQFHQVGVEASMVVKVAHA